MSEYSYEQGPEPIAAIGRMIPFGARVLVYAKLETDGYRGKLQIPTYNAIDAAAFEILAVGEGVAEWCTSKGFSIKPEVGMHCDVRSVASERVNRKDVSSRFWIVPVEDITALWHPVDETEPGLADARDAVRFRGDLVAKSAASPIVKP